MEMATLDEETSKNVLRQVEFYFSDSNLPRDKFMMKTISESEDGFVSLALLCSFSRMKNHLKLNEKTKPDDVSEDTVKAVAEVLCRSTALKISEDGKKVGRVSELVKPEEVIEQADSRTVAASPFQYKAKREDVECFFGEHAKVASVRLPRHVTDKRIFCGTVLVEFHTEEDMEKVRSLDLVYAGAKLEFQSKKEFDEERATQAQEVVNEREKKSNDSESYPKGLILAFTLKKISPENCEENGTKKAENGKIHVPISEGEIDSSTNDSETINKHADGDKPNGDEEKTNTENGRYDRESSGDLTEAGEAKPNAFSLSKNNMDIVSREDLKLIFEKFGVVKYVDFSIGNTSGYIRFEMPEGSQKARAAALLVEEEGLVVKNYIAVLEPVIGDAEREYWAKCVSYKESIYNNHGKRGRDGKLGNGGKRFHKKRSRCN